MENEKQNKKIEEAKKEYEYVIKHFKPQTKLYTVLRSVSRSGMSRKIDVYYFHVNEKNEIEKYYLNGLVESLGLFNRDKYKTESLKVSGCGMDMGFHVVATLSQALYNDYKYLSQEWL